MDKIKKYHHGDLKSKLCEILLDYVRSDSLHDFSLRETAKIIGVSSSAPYKHFSNKNSLIKYTIFKCKCSFIEYLKSNMLHNDKYDLTKIGKLYLIYAYENPEIFTFMFSKKIKVREKYKPNLELRRLFEKTIKDMIGQSHFRRNVSFEAAVYLAWTMIHGTAYLIAIGDILEVEKDKQYISKLLDELSTILVIGVSKSLKIK